MRGKGIVRSLYLWALLTPAASLAINEEPWLAARGLTETTLIERAAPDADVSVATQAQALLTLAERALHESADAAGEYLTRATDLLDGDTETETMAHSLRCQLQHRQALPEAAQTCGRLIAQTETSDNRLIQAAVHTTLAYYFYREGDHPRSLAEAERGLELATAVDDPAFMAAGQNLIGLHFSTRLLPRMSLPHFESALTSARRLPFTGPMIVTQLNLASSYTYLGRAREALTMLREASASPMVNMYPTRRLVVQSMIVQARAAIGETDGAQEKMREVIDEVRDTVLPDGMTFGYMGLGIVQLADKQPFEALSSFGQVLEMTGEDFTSGLQHPRIQLVAVPFAKALRESGDPEAARALLTRFVAAIPPDRPDQLLLDAYRELALTYEATGDPIAAKRASDEATSIESRLWDASFQYQMARLNASLDTDRQNFELERAREREAALRERAERETTLRRQTWVIGGMLLMLVALLFSRRLQKQTADAERAANSRLEDEVRTRTRELETEMAKRMAVEIERRQLSETMLEGEKLRSMGQLTAGIAHDFNNLMTIVTLGADQLRHRFAADANAAETLRHIKSAADSGARITRGLLSYVRKQPLRPQLVALDEFMEEALPIWRNTLGERFSLRTQFEPCRTRVDTSQLTTAMLNLLLNAKESMPTGGTVSIVLRTESERAQIVVADQGSGMSEVTQQQAVDPFFTTKEHGDGSGLGLSMVYGFARQSDGDLTIESELHKGTTITLTLPMATAADTSEGIGVHTADLQIPAGTRVLAVEDRTQLLHILEPALAQLGLDVTTANNATDALRKIEKHGMPDLVVTDIVMPGALDGIGLVEKLRSRKPDLPVVLMSGYSESVDHECTFLRKPFSVTELELAIEQTLSAKRSGLAS